MRRSHARILVAALALVAVGVLALLALRPRDGVDASVAPASASADRAEMPENAVEIARTDARPVVAVASTQRRGADAGAISENGRSAPRVVPVTVWVYPPKVAIPVVGVTIELALAPPGREIGVVAVASAQAGDDGFARFELGVERIAEARARRDGSRIVARVRESGYQMQYDARDLSARNDAISLSVLARRGGTIVGRVVDEGGNGVPDAWVQASDETFRTADARSIADGVFALHLDDERKCDVFAQAVGRGTAASLGFHAVFTDPPQSIELALVGPGRLRGRVRDSNGAAAAGVRLSVDRPPSDTRGNRVAFDRSFEPGSEPLELVQVARLERGGRGLTTGNATTDADGRFDVTGLQLDVYRIRAQRLGVAGPDFALTPVPVPADGRELDLVFDRPHIVVRLVEPNGRRSTILPAVEQPLGSRYDAREGWPAKPTVRARSAASTSAVGPAQDGRAEALADGTCVFEVEAGAAYHVDLAGGELALVSERVEVAAGATRVEVELVAKPSAVGRVVPEVVDDSGEATEDELTIRLEDVDTGRTVLELDTPGSPSRSWPPGFDAPVGTWRLVVEARSGFSGAHGTFVPARRFGRCEQDVIVRAGETTTTRMQLPLGARLRVTARGSIAAVAEEAAGVGNGFVVPFPFDGVSAVTLMLTRPARCPEPVPFWITGWSHPARMPVVELGKTATSEILPAGAFTLEASLPDGRVVRVPVVLVDGVTTDVVVEFPER